MSTRILKLLAVVFPLFFMIAVILLRVTLFSPERALEGNIYAVMVVAIGATLFSVLRR